MVNKFDTQFLIEGSNLDEDDIRAYVPMGEDFKRNLVCHEVSEHGDLERAFEESDVVIDRVYETQATEQSMMEPFSAEGDCLIVVGDEEVVKVHYHTDTPWKVLEYAASQGDLHKIIVENMERQANGLDG